MKNSVKRIMSAIGTVGLLSLPLVAFGQATGLDAQAPQFAGTIGGNNLIGSIQTIVSALLVLVGIVAAIYLVWAGIKYITSAGDEDKAGEAKQQILYALIGIIVIALSAVAVNFILSSVV